MVTVNTILEAAEEINKQLQQKHLFPHNSELLNSVDAYLDSCVNRVFDPEELIHNYLAYELEWEEREAELFPMKL